MDAAARHSENRQPRLLFVDDEQRVLNSMRIMFRKDYELFLASRGSEALEIVDREDIDVIVADHRMPQMTGVEVLSQVRSRSPRTVRILLTGYADLDAVEGSINESEVFRFLTKPCAPQQLKDTVELAARLARDAPAHSPEAPDADDGEPEVVLGADDGDDEVPLAEAEVEIVLETPPTLATPAPDEDQAGGPRDGAADFTRTDVIDRAPTVRPEPRRRPAAGLGIVVFSSDAQVVETVQRAVRGRIPVYRAGNIVQVVKILTDHRPGVLVSDISTDRETMQSMLARLKEHLPQLVTVAVSKHRDVLDMVWLINHGQVFRFLHKPLSAGRCAVSLQAALHYHRALLKNPELGRRHEVEAAADGGLVEGVWSKLKTVKRLWASA